MVMKLEAASSEPGPSAPRACELVGVSQIVRPSLAQARAAHVITASICSAFLHVRGRTFRQIIRVHGRKCNGCKRAPQGKPFYRPPRPVLLVSWPRGNVCSQALAPPPGVTMNDAGTQHRDDGTAKQHLSTYRGKKRECQCFLKRKLLDIERKGMLHVCWVRTPCPWGSRSLRGVCTWPPTCQLRDLGETRALLQALLSSAIKRGADLSDPGGLMSGVDSATQRARWIKGGDLAPPCPLPRRSQTAGNWERAPGHSLEASRFLFSSGSSPLYPEETLEDDTLPPLPALTPSSWAPPGPRKCIRKQGQDSQWGCVHLQVSSG